MVSTDWLFKCSVSIFCPVLCSEEAPDSADHGLGEVSVFLYGCTLSFFISIQECNDFLLKDLIKSFGLEERARISHISDTVDGPDV